MKIILVLALIPMLALSEVPVKRKGPLPLGSIIPKANVKMQQHSSSREVSMKQAGRSNGLLVIFNSNTCPTVVKNQFRLVDIASFALGNKVGVIMLNSNEANRDGSDSRATMKAYADVQGYRWLYVLDKNSEIADAFGARLTPECFLFNKFGRLVYHGAIDDNPNDEKLVANYYLRDAITSISAGEPIIVKESRLEGCAIKRK